MQSNCTFPVSVLLAFAGNKNKNLKENLILIEKKKKQCSELTHIFN